MRLFATGLLSAALVFSVSLPPLAMAAPGETSGPAAGKETTPSAATQKQAQNPDGTSAGAPGVAGKQGAESGAQPKNSSSNHQ